MFTAHEKSAVKNTSLKKETKTSTEVNSRLAPIGFRTSALRIGLSFSLILLDLSDCVCEALDPWLAPGYRNLSRFLQQEAARSFLLLPSGRNASPSQVTHPQFVRFPQQFTNTHLYTWVERGTVRESVLPKNTTKCPRSGFKPGPLALESSALTMRPPRPPLPLKNHGKWKTLN